VFLMEPHAINRPNEPSILPSIAALYREAVSFKNGSTGLSAHLFHPVTVCETLACRPREP